MNEFYNVLFASIAAFILGLAVHSAYLHTIKDLEEDILDAFIDKLMQRLKEDIEGKKSK